MAKLTTPAPPTRKRTRIVTVTLDGYTDVSYHVCTSRSRIDTDAVGAAAMDRIYAVAKARAAIRRTAQLKRIGYTPAAWLAKETERLTTGDRDADAASAEAERLETALVDAAETEQITILLPIMSAAVLVDSWVSYPADIPPGHGPAPDDWDAWLAAPVELINWIADAANNRPPEPIDPNSAAPSSGG